MRPVLAALALSLAACASAPPEAPSAPEAPPSADLAYLTADAARQFEGVRGIADTTQQYGYGDELSSETLYRAPLAADSAREALVTVTTGPEGNVTATYRATFGLSTSELSFDQREERRRRSSLNDAARDALADSVAAALPAWTRGGYSSSPVYWECPGFFGRSVELSTSMRGAHLEVRSGERPCLSAADQALLRAAASGDVAAIEAALEAGGDLTVYGDPRATGTGDSFGATPLDLAVYGEHEDAVRRLLERGASPEGLAAEFEGAHTPLSQATAPIARLLLAAGADVNAPGGTGDGALGTAVSFGDIERVRVLLDAGANPNVSSPMMDGQTPLISAAVNGSPEAVRLLLDAGATPDDATTIGYTPLLSVASVDEPESVEIARLLLAAGADVNRASSPRSSYAWTPLMEAARKGNAAMVRFLLTVEGVDLAARSTEGLTALGAAREASEDETAALLEAAGVPE